MQGPIADEFASWKIRNLSRVNLEHNAVNTVQSARTSGRKSVPKKPLTIARLKLIKKAVGRVTYARGLVTVRNNQRRKFIIVWCTRWVRTFTFFRSCCLRTRSDQPRRSTFLVLLSVSRSHLSAPDEKKSRHDIYTYEKRHEFSNTVQYEYISSYADYFVHSCTHLFKCDTRR